MARSEARLQFGMWRAGLDGLSPHSKLVYCVLLTEPTLNHCGVGAVRMSRWAKDASLTIADTEKALQELVDGGFVVVDDDTEEVFVRTLIRNDGVAAQPYVLKGALREAVQTASAQIRRVLASELRKLPPQQPEGVSKRGTKVVYPDPHATADVLDPAPPVKPTRKGPETLFDGDPSERVSEGSMSKGSRSLHGGGGGGGGGNSSSVGTPVSRSAGAAKRADTAEETNPNKIAQRLARAYHERVPLCSFVAVMKIVKKAIDAGYPAADIEAALNRLADTKRSVTADALRIELDGRPLQSVPAAATQMGWQSMKTGSDAVQPFAALPGGESA